ncbi:hypothetical protein NP493_2888g00000 [Ridgeia piscesae]|uniref:Uncharacterized protein n=1 Tax=Ridgeia piscesae TaxID=27915 RepID=A0AAD9JBT2_RIDPI|nr:hypothetical protein NP493_2888g00000 [Ridgeia piscesae]
MWLQRSTVDMIFCLRQLQERCIEQGRPLYMVFVDLHDNALVAHSAEEMQKMDAFSDASKNFGLKINIKKTEKESPVDLTPHEDVTRDATKADSLLSAVFWSQKERAPSSPVQGYHQEKLEAERHKVRLMDINLTAER